MQCSKCGNHNVIIKKEQSGQLLCKDCFIESIEKKVIKTIKKEHLLDKGDKVLVALSGGKDSAALSIYLKQKFIRDRLPEIVGLAINKGEAIKMVRAITEACVNMTGDADLVPFLEKHPVIENFKKVSIVK